ncbi:Ig-like domain-containing protein [Herbiconiux sp. P18]|uniref:Ig-like domain-containing protein n=1 Tax=Herbiconiux liangxiaofengii TaxID=3342795 RepID=UPI0035B91030
MTLSSRARSGALAGSLALLLGASALAAGPAVASPAPAQAAASGATEAAAKAEAAATGTPLTITPNPAYQNQAFEGWGTSLVWFANATGDYPTDVRQDLFDKVFGEDGLNLNIARYNIGGGNAYDVPPYLRQGAAVDGWWNPDLQASDAQGPITSDYADRDRYAAAWNPDDPASYDFSADETQRWWVSQLKDTITKWEAFANSPPYFMTESGYVSGGFDSSAEQLKPEAVGDYVAYLKTVVESVEQQEGITFDTVDPFNEPNTNYWGTNIDQNTGWPRQGGQEGAHIGPQVQDQVIKALAAELAEDTTTTDAVISAMDETNPGLFAQNWNTWSDEAKADVAQLNVHTYGTGGRPYARDIAKAADKPLWMSEIEGDWDGSGVNNQTNMANGLGVAARITDDLRELEPSAWVLWQPVEDAYNMEKVEKLNWGSVQIDFDCNADGDSVRRLADGDADPSCKVETNAKYNTIRNFTHYIRPGDHIIPSTDAQTTTALKGDGSGVTLVHSNPSTSEQTITVDLSKFGQIAAGATLTPIVTTESPADDVTKNALVEGTAVAVDAAAKTATVTVPARSVSTFVVSGVSGVADAAVPLRDGATYQLVGTQSGKALTPNTAVAAGTAPGATITTTTAENASSRLWTVDKLTDGSSNSERYVFRAANGQVLGASSAGVVLRDQTAEQAAADRSSQWILTTSTGASWSLVNAQLATALEVPGQSTAEGAPVNVYQSNNGANQAWSFRDTALQGFEPVAVNTVAGVAPTLPATVTPVYASGAGIAVPVTWNTEGIDWNVPGTVTVTGSGTDAFGTAFTNATATVEVGGFTATDPVSLTTYAGASAADVEAVAPATVPARIGASSTSYDAAVTWDFSPLIDANLAAPGVVTVPGEAQSNDPAAAPLPATLSLIVTEPVSANIAPDAATTASATFTEPGYSVDATRNRVLDDKGWSNWVGGAKRASDTLSYDLGSVKTVDGVTLRFFKDGSSESWPTSVTVEYRTPEGAWVAAPGSPVAVVSPNGAAPVLEVALGGVRASAVRAQLTAKANTHMIVSEVEIYAAAPGVSTVSGLARLAVDGTTVDGFDPAVTSYVVPITGSRLPVPAAFPIDTAATVVVDPATEANGATATVTVTAPDGVSSTAYTVRFDRTVAVSAVLSGTQIEGAYRVGSPLAVVVTADPASAAAGATVEWLRDGSPIAGATGPSYTPVPDDAGREVSARVTAGAAGFRSGTAVSAAVGVQAAIVPPAPPVDPGPGGPGDGGGSGSGTGSGSGGSSTPAGLAATGSDPRGLAALALVLLLGGLTLGLRRLFARTS